jgi:hypothetical protein
MTVKYGEYERPQGNPGAISNVAGNLAAVGGELESVASSVAGTGDISGWSGTGASGWSGASGRLASSTKSVASAATGLAGKLRSVASELSSLQHEFDATIASLTASLNSEYSAFRDAVDRAFTHANRVAVANLVAADKQQPDYSSSSSKYATNQQLLNAANSGQQINYPYAENVPAIRTTPADALTNVTSHDIESARSALSGVPGGPDMATANTLLTSMKEAITRAKSKLDAIKERDHALPHMVGGISSAAATIRGAGSSFKPVARNAFVARPGVLVTVESGDTLSGIGEHVYGGSTYGGIMANVLNRRNQLGTSRSDPNTIHTGDQFVLYTTPPKAKPKTAPPATDNPPSPPQQANTPQGPAGPSSDQAPAPVLTQDSRGIYTLGGRTATVAEPPQDGAVTLRVVDESGTPHLVSVDNNPQAITDGILHPEKHPGW